MKNIAILSTALFAATALAQDFLGLRDLQAANNLTIRPLPKLFPDNINIAFNSKLGCGACLRGNYIYCIPGAEGSDPTTWAAGRTAVCCQNSSSCPQLTNTTFNCSSNYKDMKLAQAMCPFNKKSCGQNPKLNFTAVNQTQSVNISLAAGETCTYQIEATCGLPTIQPNDTTGFEIITIDSDDDDLATRTTQAVRNITSILFDKDSRKPPPKGPQMSKFDPSVDGAMKKYKGGLNFSEPICKKRYQQVSITALANLTSASSRILQAASAPTYSMTLLVSSSTYDSSSETSAVKVILSVATMALSVLALIAF